MGIGVGVMILKDNRVLLGRRHDDPTKADSALHGEGTWTMPGGKLDFGETFEDCAFREVYEETGIKIKSIKIISVSNDKVPDAHFVTIGVLATDFEGEPMVREPDEITEWRWFPLDSPPTPMFFPSERMLQNYKAGVIYAA